MLGENPRQVVGGLVFRVHTTFVVHVGGVVDFPDCLPSSFGQRSTGLYLGEQMETSLSLWFHLSS